MFSTIKTLFVGLLLITALPTTSVHAQHAHGAPSPVSYNEARIEKFRNSSNVIQQVVGVNIYDFEVTFIDGGQEGERVAISDMTIPQNIGERMKVGDHVIIASMTEPSTGNTLYYVADFVRQNELGLIILLLVITVILIARWQGTLSFLGMIVSFFILIKFIVPRILQGDNPLLISLAAALVVIPLTFLLGHGANRKTLIAMVATFLTLALTGLLAVFSVDFVKLSGMASEEVHFLQSYQGGVINLRDLLLAGIIIAAMGILDDITISQTAIVQELAIANPKYSFAKLYFHAMKVGRDHIASLVNTLILVYAGASLPIFILFVDQSLPLTTVINHEVIATEIVRTAVSSIGIITAVPITTVIAGYIFAKYPPSSSETRTHHH